MRRLIRCLPLLLFSAAMALGQTSSKEKDVQSKPATVPNQTLAVRFRVTLTGFTVNNQTEDNVLEIDGKGDEVYILTEIAQYDSYLQIPNTLPGAIVKLGDSDNLRGNGYITERRSLMSVLMGDVNNQTHPTRIQAGSASIMGGLRTGDRFPSNEPWRMSGAPSANRLPMSLWEGELRSRDLVVIVPTIWEWDGGNQQLRTQFTEEVDRYFLPTSFDPFRGIIWGGLTGVDIFGAGDRPIGMLANRFWFPRALVLNLDTAQRAAATSPSNVGIGVDEIRYFAGDESYSLYFKIERLPS